MSLYQIIANQLSMGGFDYKEEQLELLDIIGYMTLESAGLLQPLQDKPLKCVFRAGYTSNFVFHDARQRSCLEFGFKSSLYSQAEPSIRKEEKLNFLQLVRIIKNKFPDSKEDSYRSFYNLFKTFAGFIIPNDVIKKIIQSSSLFIAIGDLSKFNLGSLLLLKKKLNLYKISNEDLSLLVDRLVDKVNTYILENFDLTLVQQTLPKVEKKFENLIAISKEERRFNQLTEELCDKLLALIIEKAPNPSLLNKKEYLKYSRLICIKDTLNNSLIKTQNNFFNNLISKKSFENFKQDSLRAIEDSKKEFAKLYSWAKWHKEFHPALKSIFICLKATGGVIAGATILPAVLTELYSEHGYKQTFFSNEKLPLKLLNTFEQKLRSKNGFFYDLNIDLKKEISFKDEAFNSIITNIGFN